MDLYERGHELVFTHGNGPQVGQLLLQNEEAESAAEKPLDVLGAESQAQIGYLLQQQLREELGETPATVITQTIVDEDDPAFDDPTKRIGPFYDEDEASEKDFPVKEGTDGDGNVGYRRVVPSPKPVDIVEAEHIKTLVETGKPVISSGGGGVPVVEDGDSLTGVAAVIDKDRAAQSLATDIGADEFLVLTDVDAVYRNFGTEDEEELSELTTEEAADMLAAGEFGEGAWRRKSKRASSSSKAAVTVRSSRSRRPQPRRSMGRPARQSCQPTSDRELGTVEGLNSRPGDTQHDGASADINDVESEEIEQLLDLAASMKENPGEFSGVMDNKSLVMLFAKPSTRTRLSFETGMTQLGGHGIFFEMGSSQLSRGSRSRREPGDVPVRGRHHGSVVRARRDDGAC